MSGTISNTITHGYTLLTSPTTIAPTGAVYAASGAAVLGPSPTGWWVINQGTASAASGVGIALAAGGTVDNQTGAQIYGASAGVSVAGAAGYVTNAGTVQASLTIGDSPGVTLSAGGSVTNTAGLIAGYSGVKIAGAPGTITNDADIVGAGNVGVSLAAGGWVSNASGGYIFGYLTGIGIGSSGTILNAGRVGVGTLGHAVVMSGGLLYNQASGSLLGIVQSGDIALVAGGGTVVNAGLIADISSGAASGVGLLGGSSLTNMAHGVIEAAGQAVSASGIAIVANSGTIRSFGVYAVGNATGVALPDGGTITNATGGTIEGPRGVYIGGASGTLTNYGIIQGLAEAAVLLGAPGLMSNAGTGVISGYTDGVAAAAGAGLTVLNQGMIEATGAAGIGAYLRATGTIDNEADATIAGATGVSLLQGGTVIDAGTIAATGGGDALAITAGYASRLVADPGATFIGTVDGGNAVATSSVSVLEFASGDGTLTGIGDSIVNFGSILFDSGAAWQLSATPDGVADGQAISGFAFGDAIDLVGVSDTISGFAGGTLTLDGSDPLDLLLPGTLTAAQLQATPSADGTDLKVICFAAGTHIATPGGDVPVEQLQTGDFVLTRAGVPRALVWIGVGRVLATRGQRSAATPVIVRKGALADNVPHRDLRVTKGHALYLDGVLIPVEFLVNHRSILWDDRAQEVTLYHLELASHDVLLANGAAAESYRDDGNRWLFRNANSGWELPPQSPCAPVLAGGPIVDAVWRRLLERSGPRNALPLTDDADLHLLVDGQRIDAMVRCDGRHAFRLRARPRSVRICSRAAVPQELGIARDDRLLGVAVKKIVLAQPRGQRAIDPDSASLVEGFHAFEQDNGIRWTFGDAAVPAELFSTLDGPGMLLLHLGGTTQYLDEGTAVRAA